ncbi:hypothetical protein Pmani_007497 [Petrolisthes manimaculis]|uniref:Uncharacterized protein n=1 Tax=Petrolisthes manimaculis TaxID=1843537 RepID=A0AAE1Q8U3_9EUCA|nr:hypothetical protein Pmani_007497 [Petrolisthes manimaculis]
MPSSWDDGSWLSSRYIAEDCGVGAGYYSYIQRCRSGVAAVWLTKDRTLWQKQTCCGRIDCESCWCSVTSLHQGLGDRKPSELMNEMLALMEGHKFCLLYEQIFLEQMPEDIRLLLAQDTFTDPRGLAARADELWQTKQQEGAYISRIAALPGQEKQTVTRTATPSTANRDKWCYYHQRWGFRCTAMSTTLHASGKHLGRPSVVAAAAGQIHHLHYIWDRHSGVTTVVGQASYKHSV